MKNRLQRIIWVSLGSFILLIPVNRWAISESLQGSPNIQIYSSDFHSETKSRVVHFDDAAEGLVGEPAQHELVNIASALIHFRVDDPLIADSIAADLGKFDSEIVVKPVQANKYPVEIRLSVFLPDGMVKFVQREMALYPQMGLRIDDKWKESLAEEFSEMTAKEFKNFNDQYGVQFRENLKDFAKVYALNMLREAPRIARQLMDYQKNNEKTLEQIQKPVPIPAEVRPLPKPPAHNPLNVRMEHYNRSEAASFTETEFRREVISVPQYTSQSTFKLTAPSTSEDDSYTLGAVEYQVSTLPLPSGQLRTTFDLNVDYLLKARYTHSESLVHEAGLVEDVFFQTWKERVLKPLEDQITAGGEGTEENQRLRKLFVSYLEPYMAEEFYDFFPFLAKFKVIMANPETNKKLEKYRKKKEKLAKKLRPSGF